MCVKIKLSAFLILVMNGLFIFILKGQETTINYLSSSSEIANPERGWYDHFETNDGYYSTLNAQELINNRKNDHITLILRLFYLKGFIDQDSVSADYLAKMQNDFDSIRKAGIKCIVRFAYSSSQNADVFDATPEKVFSQIESLKHVLLNNSDVIAGLQAGFIGAWGEWYYTENFAGAGYIPSSTDQENRRILVEKLLNILPEHISVQGRTPAIMKNINQTPDPISDAEAFNGSIKSRVGHHNDCFVANYSDYGTYTNLTNDIAYLHETTKYTITGGETCDASNDYSNCENSVPRMKELHWTYLNRDYNRAVYNKWVEEGCYDEVNISLGYRIRLDSAVIADSVEPGSILNLSFSFTNEGYAAPTQYKPIQIVLTHTITGVQNILDYSGTNDDIRHWLPGQILLDGEVTIPADLPDANYSLAIRFPDQAPGLADNPAYSIQLANVGIWDSDNGINYLTHIISVGEGGEGELPNAPIDLGALAISETEIDIAWVDNSTDEIGFELMRSEGISNNWIHLANLDENTTSYANNNLKKGTTYYYIIRAVNNYGNSSWSSPSGATTLGINFVNEASSQAIEVYPTLLQDDELKIRFFSNDQKTILISRISGEKIFEAVTNQNEFQISRATFNSGIYIISIYQDNHITTKKLIVL